mgnify:FL=1
MKLFLLFIFLLSLLGCNKPKTVLICGDHVCVNKAEAEQFFEENLSLEVKIIDKENTKEINLVELNLKSNEKGNKKIAIIKKKQTNKELKILSKNEILQKKSQLKKRNNIKKKKNVKKSKNNPNQLDKTNNNENSKIRSLEVQKAVYNQKKLSRDICTIIEICNIEEISKYLIKKAKEGDFPDITIRE